MDQSTVVANESDSQGIGVHRSKNLVIAFMALYILLALLVIVGNTFVIVAFKRVRTRRAINIFFVSLAVSDLMVGAVSIPLWIYIFSFPYFTSSVSVEPNQKVVDFHRSFDVFSALASISNLVAIAIERQYAICWPIKHKASSFTRFYSMILAVWSYSLIITVFYSLPLSPSWEQEYRSVLSFTAGFVIPVIVIIAAYSSIYIRVRSMSNFWKSTSARSSLRINVQQEKRTAMTVVIVAVLFLLAWLPFFVVTMLYSFYRASLPDEGSGFTSLLDFVKWMHYSNSIVNPLIYTYRSQQIRKMLGIMLLRLTGRQRQGRP
ncbi:trace amine-associated receptor 1-like [Montipora foliosa]|uniref:trace amine-associated receptor 1-like n=1 Tax=Montipora foliosa TaxID=591990 RepID=UPI0035F1A76F